MAFSVIYIYAGNIEECAAKLVSVGRYWGTRFTIHKLSCVILKVYFFALLDEIIVHFFFVYGDTGVRLFAYLKALSATCCSLLFGSVRACTWHPSKLSASKLAILESRSCSWLIAPSGKSETKVRYNEDMH